MLLLQVFFCIVLTDLMKIASFQLLLTGQTPHRCSETRHQRQQRQQNLNYRTSMGNCDPGLGDNMLFLFVAWLKCTFSSSNVLYCVNGVCCCFQMHRCIIMTLQQYAEIFTFWLLQTFTACYVASIYAVVFPSNPWNFMNFWILPSNFKMSVFYYYDNILMFVLSSDFSIEHFT